MYIVDGYLYESNARFFQLNAMTFLANVGGLMGLCLGISLVGCFEVVYHTASVALKICLKI
jgi:hypothetical protein